MENDGKMEKIKTILGVITILLAIPPCALSSIQLLEHLNLNEWWLGLSITPPTVLPSDFETILHSNIYILWIYNWVIIFVLQTLFFSAIGAVLSLFFTYIFPPPKSNFFYSYTFYCNNDRKIASVGVKLIVLIITFLLAIYGAKYYPNILTASTIRFLASGYSTLLVILTYADFLYIGKVDIYLAASLKEVFKSLLED